MKYVSVEDLVRSIADDPEINGSNFARVKRHIDALPTVEVVHGDDTQRIDFDYEAED